VQPTSKAFRCGHGTNGKTHMQSTWLWSWPRAQQGRSRGLQQRPRCALWPRARIAAAPQSCVPHNEGSWLIHLEADTAAAADNALPAFPGKHVILARAYRNSPAHSHSVRLFLYGARLAVLKAGVQHLHTHILHESSDMMCSLLRSERVSSICTLTFCMTPLI